MAALNVSLATLSIGPFNAVGQVVSFQAVVSNSGSVPVTGVTVTYTLSAPAAGSGTLATDISLAPGASDMLRFSYTLTQADLNNGSVNAVAEAATTSATAFSSDTVVMTQNPGLAITDTVTSVVDSNHDGITDAGDVIKYSVVATNTGNVTLSGVTVTDPLGGGTLASGVTLLPGASDTLTASHTLTQADMDAGTSFVDTATASGRSPNSGIVDVGPVSDSVSTPLGGAPCYCRGTLIRKRCGEEPVEKLQLGDAVMTAAGVARPIKWIGRRSYGGRFVMGRKDILPVCIKAGALADNVPKRDLWISPNHAMYFKDEHGGVLIEAKDLVNGVSIVQAERVEQVEYFHIELETHDVIIAEGALSESFIDDDSRGMFHNAYEYRTLYTDAPAALARYCAARVDEGYELESVRRRIALRAGLVPSHETARAGDLRGYVDRVSTDLIEGWAQNVDHPEAPVCLDIYASGRLIGQVLANRYRADLAQAGIGSGHHSFVFAMSAGLAFTTDAVEVRRSLDGAPLMLTANAWRAPQRVAVSADDPFGGRAVA